MNVLVAYDPKLAAYRFPARHPLVPERFTLAVDLMRGWDLLVDDGGAPEKGVARISSPHMATDDELLLGHTPEYIEYVKLVSEHPEAASQHGLGWGDTPGFSGMHAAAALAVGATIEAIEAVVEGSADRAHSPAGGLHHAHKDHASGFCVYNDAVIGIETAIRSNPGMRVAYLDIDAHHGDGVEAAFSERDDVLTLSVHESGRYLFPGTGRAADIGTGAGTGFSVNVPLPPFAGPHCWFLVFEEVVAPALTAFAPDLLVVQGGGDTHFGDPLTHLSQTIEGYVGLMERIIALTDDLTGGSAVLLGGGGYLPYDAVPRMWASAMAVLLERDVPQELPEAWLAEAQRLAAENDGQAPASRKTLDERSGGPDEEQAKAALGIVHAVIKEVRAASPLLRGAS